MKMVMAARVSEAHIFSYLSHPTQFIYIHTREAWYIFLVTCRSVEWVYEMDYGELQKKEKNKEDDQTAVARHNKI